MIVLSEFTLCAHLNCRRICCTSSHRAYREVRREGSCFVGINSSRKSRRGSDVNLHKETRYHEVILASAFRGAMSTRCVYKPMSRQLIWRSIYDISETETRVSGVHVRMCMYTRAAQRESCVRTHTAQKFTVSLDQLPAPCDFSRLKNRTLSITRTAVVLCVFSRGEIGKPRCASCFRGDAENF